MKYLWWLLLICLVFLLQNSMSILSVSPNLTLLVVYFIGIRYGGTWGLLMGALIGSLEDILASSMIGPNMLAKGAAGFLSASFLSGNVLIWTPFFGTIAVALLTFMSSSIVFLSLSVFSKPPTHPSSALFTAIMQSLMNALAGIFMRPRDVD